jgi:hypothetical protein
MVMVILSMGGIVLGQQVKKANLVAAQLLTVITWLVFVLTLFHLGITGRGWYEVCFFGLLVIDGHVAVRCINVGRPKMPIDETDNSSSHNP